MAMNVILAIADGSPATDATLSTAVMAAKKAGAELNVLHVRPDPASMVPVVGEAMSGALVEQMIDSLAQSADKRAGQARAAFQTCCEGAGLNVNFEVVSGAAPDIVGIRGRLADLIVVSRPGGDDIPTQTAVLDAALFDTARPVLIAPSATPASLCEHAVIAWNGSIEATRAVAGGMALLRLARRVTVLVAGDDDRRLPADALIAYLEKHGVKATTERIANEGGPTGRLLVERAVALDGDLLVMGAYGHSRVRELILGGATHHVIANGGITVLMDH
jgi:nucleotide-binding universal stress UspA family protein